MKLAFVWQGISQPEILNHWDDGLRSSIEIIKKKHDVTFHEPWDDIEDVDIILYWEAPCTWQSSENGDHYRKVARNQLPKALLFAGGQIKPEWVQGFDLLFVESGINEKECDDWGIPWLRAFGINDTVFKPKKMKKMYDGIHQGTCASWKRQWLGAEALGEKMLIVGRPQESDPMPFEKSKELGACVVSEEQDYETIAELLNQSVALVQTSDYWGGGQRATLEAMACNVPPIVMSDSPKNREYVEESGYGIVVEPNALAIRQAVEEIKKWTPEQLNRGRDYIEKKWTAQCYAENLLKGIEQICNSKNK